MILEQIRRAVEVLTAPLRYHGVYEYRCLTSNAGRVDCQIVDPTGRLPDQLHVDVRPGVPGAKGTPTPGSTLLVGFINGDPARPYVCAFETPSAAAGFAPIDQEIDATLDTTLGHSIPTNLPDSLGRHLCVGDWITVPGIGAIPVVLNASSPSMASTKRKALPGP